MIRLRLWSALIVTVVTATALRAGAEAASPWVVDRSLTVAPQSAPVPALKYRLLPLSSTL